MYTAHRYTEIMNSLFQRQTSCLQSFYCREDFSHALHEYRKTKKSGNVWRRKDLERLCAARGINCDALIQDESLLNNVPTRQELIDQLLEIFYNLYSYAPSPTAYMERIVRRLAPEFCTDTVRTAILKKFLMGGGVNFATYDSKPTLLWAVEKMSPEVRRQYDAAPKTEQLDLAISQIDDSIFTPNRLSVTELTHKEMLELMDGRWSSISKEIEDVHRRGFFSDVSNHARNQLRNFCKSNDITFSKGDSVNDLASKIIKEISNFCRHHNVPSKDDTDFIVLLHSIIKSFITRAHCDITDEQMEFISSCFWLLMRKTTYVNRNNQEATADNLFRTDIRDAERRKQGKEWELLRLCDNLAAGNFKNNNGKTRIWLYQFAIMFSMTVAIKYGEERDPDNDIVKNLFEDYYCDNMVRFLDSSYADSNFASTQEKEPSGEGINLKNFAEAIYIYYLYRKDLSLTPGQRIDQAETTIKKCILRAKGTKSPVNSIKKRDYTSLYEQRMIDKIICASESDLIELIVANYDISSQSNSLVGQSSDTNTAFDIMREAMGTIEEGDVYAGYAPPDYGSNDEAKELAKILVDDIRYMSDFKFGWDLAPLLRNRYGENQGFARIVNHINQRLSSEIDSIGRRRINLFSDMLHILSLHSSKESPLDLETFKEYLQSSEAALTGDQIKSYATTLSKFGFEVHKVSQNKESFFYLDQQSCHDELISQILSRVKIKYRYHDEEEKTARQELFSQLFDRDEHANRKVTRTTLIAVLTYSYIIDIQNRTDLTSLPDVYNDFTTTLNVDLIESRFQPLCEKNILDMFVILSVYLYLIKYGKGDYT